MIITLAYLALIIGIVLVACGYTVEARALRPGWGLVILAVVLIVIAYVVLPGVHPVALPYVAMLG